MSGVNLSLFKQLRILSNLHIHRCLGFLWLDVKEDKKKTYFCFKFIFFIPENEISNGVEVF